LTGPGEGEALLQTLESQLAPAESVLATLHIDLDRALQFSVGVLVLTPTRLLSRQGDGAWQTWPLTAPDLALNASDYAGIGTLDLVDAQGLRARWHYTLGAQAAALRLLRGFEQCRAGQAQAVVQEARGGESAQESADPEANAPPSTWVLLRLWRFARPYKKQLIGGLLLTLLSTGATLVPPYLTMPLMDDVLIPFQNGQHIAVMKVAMYLGALLAAALVGWGLGWARTYLLALVSERIGADLRTAAYQHLLTLPLDYFGGKRTGDLMTRIGSESDRINVFLSLYALDFVTDVLMITMTAVILISIDPLLALVTLIPLPFIAWMIHSVRDRLRIGFEKTGRVWSEITNVLADTIPGIRVVKAFAQERREVERFRLANQYSLQANDRVNKTWSLFTPTISLLTEIGLLIVWAFGIWEVAHGSIKVGVLTAFIAYIGRFYTRLDSMSRIVSITQKAATAAKRMFDILDHVNSVPEPEQPVRIERVTGRIDLNQVGFRYGARAVIHDVNLAIEPGEMIGLVGHSGSGKSTLVNLICRFYDVSEGAIRVDGVDVRQFAVTDYRQHVGLVLQEPFLFFGTIAQNIAYGKPQATREEIVAAARAAHAHDFILRLPHGYDSLVGERGQGLSGGERQRISIARALLIDPRILILDEATSAVDTETEKEIQRALDNLVQGRTTIAIAHRLSTLRKASRLVVMDAGRIVEVGPHDDLIARQGAYWRLYQAQARQLENDDIGAQTETGALARTALPLIEPTGPMPQSEPSKYAAAPTAGGV
jgi:ATP-binding cassette subfamily B protein